MADLTITVAVTTGTQYVTGSTGSIYTFNGSQPASFTFPWVASGTLRLDQSGSSNDNHPLIFTTSNSSSTSTMRSGIISSGVTYYLDGSSNQSDYTNTSNFNSATTRYIEIAPASQADFYFACWVHGIGMGGIIDVTQNTWGALSWGNHDWGDQDTFTTHLTGLSTTSSIGSVTAFNEQGWGSDTWGAENWGESAISVTLSGFSTTVSLGEFTYAGSIAGWGSDAWGDNNWGENTTTVALDGLTMAMELGPNGWGVHSYGDGQWGGVFTFKPESIIGISGQTMAAALNDPTISRLDMNFDVSGVTMGAGLGTLSINNGADHTQGLASLTTAAAVGTITPADVVGISGVTFASSVGSISVASVELIDISGVSFAASVGAITPGAIVMGISGQTFSAGVGSISPTQMTVGLTGQTFPATLNTVGFGVLGYGDVDITGNTSFSDVDITGNTSYTDVTIAS
jgi:hypothetical protein